MNTKRIADTRVTDDTGAEVRLGDVWADKPAALVFLRHFGCSFCREHAADLQQDLDAIHAAGGEVVAIGMGTPAHAAHFREHSGITFPLLVAEDTSLHEAAGLRNGDWMSVLGPRAWGGIVRATRKGHRAKRTAADMSQLGGTFVIDTDGSTLWEHHARHSADNSSAADIAGAIRQSRAAA